MWLFSLIWCAHSTHRLATYITCVFLPTSLNGVYCTNTTILILYGKESTHSHQSNWLIFLTFSKVWICVPIQIIQTNYRIQCVNELGFFWEFNWMLPFQRKNVPISAGFHHSSHFLFIFCKIWSYFQRDHYYEYNHHWLYDFGWVQ